MDDAVYWQHLDTNPRIKRLLQALNFLQNVKQTTNKEEEEKLKEKEKLKYLNCDWRQVPWDQLNREIQSHEVIQKIASSYLLSSEIK